MTADDCVRLDIWLWRARFLKTRADAVKHITTGKVRLERAGQSSRVTKSHFKVRPGDRVTFMRAQSLIDVTVQAIGERRGPYAEARALYKDHTRAASDITDAPAE